ncbi:extracellular solute-binding protein [Cohnella zeiphila]|uniref:Extracellular solute-binding protein n=1 Tax=Cohnella zeiphila TaxID=2761120 RepID=A0A7X0VTU6_9BACL|nr:extracellular solute-binding protein [Cohnella zeiphila]MBB6729577.1 extracellular solute-binding protein [Cohnella zeiphila]
MKRKALWMSAASALTLAMLVSGCSGGGGNNGNDGQSSGPSGGTAAASSGASAAGDELPQTDGKFSPEATLTTVRAVGDDVKFKNGETIEDNVFTRWAKERLGIDIKYLWTTPSTNDAFKTKLTLSMSANEPLPDILEVSGADAHALIDSGKFQDAGALFDKYASDSYKKAMDEVPSAWMPYVRDGKRMAIPGIDYIMQHDDVMWIRQDWLDKLNLKAPTTIAELEQVMDAFVNRDPDGNGKKDTYGMISTLKENYNAWIGTGEIFGAFGAVPQIWEKDDNGDVVYGSVRPEIKTALGKLKEWIDKGYLHKEVALQDEMKASELFTSGKAGIAFGPTWLYDWPLQDVVKNVPGSVVKPYPLPAGPDGKIGQASEGTHNLVMLINKDMKHPEIYFKYINYLYDHYNDPEAGGEFEYGFAKGYDYDIIGDKPVFGADIPGGYIDPAKYFLGIPPRTPSIFIKTLADINEGKEPVTPYEKKLAQASTKQQMAAASIVVSQHQFTLDNLYTGAQTETMKDKWQNLKKMEITAFTKILYGNAGLDSFDDFVKNWYAAGGEKITQEVRDWYASVGGQ